MADILHQKILGDITAWLLRDVRNNQVRIYDDNGARYNLFCKCDNLIENYREIQFIKSDKTLLFILCSIIKGANKTIGIRINPGLSFKTSNVKIMIEDDDKVHIKPCEYNKRTKEIIIDNCHNVETIYSNIEKDFISNMSANGDTWRIPDYFQNIPKFTSFQYLLDEINTIEINI